MTPFWELYCQPAAPAAHIQCFTHVVHPALCDNFFFFSLVFFIFHVSHQFTYFKQKFVTLFVSGLNFQILASNALPASFLVYPAFWCGNQLELWWHIYTRSKPLIFQNLSTVRAVRLIFLFIDSPSISLPFPPPAHPLLLPPASLVRLQLSTP